jgi:diguanylate cyclase (GGDEF)-like protein
MRRRHLRARVLLLTAGFASALLLITVGLTWHAQRTQERWTRLLSVEMRAVAALEELVRAQNGFHRRLVAGEESPARYRFVMQLLAGDGLSSVDTRALRGRVRAFQGVIAEQEPRRVDIDATSTAIVLEAQQLADGRKREIARQLPRLKQETSSMMTSGLAVAWIVVLVSFAAAQMTLQKVVRPIEQLAAAAARIGEGDLTAKAAVAGDKEIADLGVAINLMAAKLRDRARTDELTGLPNFRAFSERSEEEVQRAARYGHTFGILVLDLDRFKKYNDSFGHSAGNDALQRVASAIRAGLRSVDFAARYGGEEFAVICPEVDGNGLRAIAERVRAGVEALPAPPHGSTVTVSIGGALFPSDASELSRLFETADERLYAAKKAGRNRVVSPPAPGVLAG